MISRIIIAINGAMYRLRSKLKHVRLKRSWNTGAVRIFTLGILFSHALAIVQKIDHFLEN